MSKLSQQKGIYCLSRVYNHLCVNDLYINFNIKLYICTSNHMFKREIWDKFTEFTFLKLFEISI